MLRLRCLLRGVHLVDARSSWPLFLWAKRLFLICISHFDVCVGHCGLLIGCTSAVLSDLAWNMFRVAYNARGAGRLETAVLRHGSLAHLRNTLLVYDGGALSLEALDDKRVKVVALQWVHIEWLLKCFDCLSQLIYLSLRIFLFCNFRWFLTLLV